ncbi:hypothetical protein PG2006B_1115 [Bifidobacterium animalis subsp. animalis]|uniref:DNA-binding protein n=1 Tax=Bifidobacterium animalis TaxID=28025 RepID=UPI0010206E6D|nr:DNA-binding protein [Bifidobacterium animalis]RYN12649.1 hypothetical protein PG2006B_1115 [Bifidobacterium animalis subsp. animalis]
MSAITKDASRVPLGERLAWTPEQAAQVYSLDVRGVRYAINHGDLDSFRAPNRDGLPGRRKVSRDAMDRWIRTLTDRD